MENPAYWTEAERIINAAHERWQQEQDEGRVGGSLAYYAARDLRRAGLLHVDHEQSCCMVHGTHTMPHKGCILR